ncbi:MAG: hypothetical protein E7525_02760 [Ruminococcaceae bacterium]|nr:hypothetical protein [Oscillospiraceae bacterium]
MYEFFGMGFSDIGDLIGFVVVILLAAALFLWIVLGWRHEIKKQRKQYENMDKPKKVIICDRVNSRNVLRCGSSHF